MTERKDERTGHATRASGSAKKRYVPPKLRVYGNVSSITRTVGKMGTVSDGGGSFSMSKTS
jgi:hypothetical protein